MRILVFVPYHGSDSHIGAKRWNHMTDEFASKGHLVHIVAPAHQMTGKAFGCKQLGRGDTKAVSVTRVAYPRRVIFKYFVNLWLHRAIWRVPLALLKRVRPRSSNLRAARLRSIAADISMWFCYPGIGWSWGVCAAKVVKERFLPNDIDIIIGSHPYSEMLKAASIVAEEWGKPWVADLRDPWSNDHQSHLHLNRNRMRRLEKRVLNTASGVVTINRQCANLLTCEKPAYIISNCYRRFDKRSVPRRQSSVVSIVYTGLIHEDSKVHVFLKGLLDSYADGRPAMTIWCKINYYGSSFKLLEKYAHALEYTGIKLCGHGFVGAGILEESIAKADLALVFGWKGHGKECVVTGKIFDYMCHEVPIIAVSENDTAMSELLDSIGAGQVLEDESAVKDFFIKLRSSPDSILSNLRARRNVSRIEEYSSEAVATVYLRYLYNILEIRALRSVAKDKFEVL